MAEDRSKISSIRSQIEKVAKGHSREVVLLGGDRIPAEVFKLENLEQLTLINTRVRRIPERIRELPNLKRIDLTTNDIEQVPNMPGLVLDWESYLQCRESLSLENILGIRLVAEKDREISPELTATIARLPGLRELLVSGRNPYGYMEPPAAVAELIASLGELSALSLLRVRALHLRDVPRGLRAQTKLQTLEISGAGLDRLPDWFCELDRLEVLDLIWNRFTQFPEIILRMNSLRGLYIGSVAKAEGIRQVPREILRLPNLAYFRVDSSTLETPPPEIVKKGLDAVRNYWRQEAEAGVDYLCEAKLLIVGEPGAGKTSLAHKLRDDSYKLKPQEASTEGIEIIRWNFPAAISLKHGGAEKLLDRDFRVNVWDFGGQEVYHATHQFFLTRRSLYVLVADDRKEDTDFNYWLTAVELLSDGSPVLIVQNEKQGRWRDINLSHLRARFANLRESHRVDLADNRGLNELTAAIRRELQALPHIGTPLPSTWKRVRQALESETRNYIGLEEYLAICRQNGFQRREDMLQLSGYLHDLGICLHFQDDPVLRKTIILKPKWGTDAVYRVLDDRTILQQRGRCSPADLARIWCDDEHADMRDELLRLMMKFQLCYELPEGNAYIAPQLLSPVQPDYKWNARDNLILRYEYDFMPKGLITRFIVAQSRLIADQTLVWKTGVVLHREGTRAEVIEDYSRRKICVRISGPDTRGLAAIVDDQLDRIHASFQHLKYEKFVPCNCAVCRTRAEPYAYSLTDLKDFAMSGDHIQCRTSRKLVDAAALIRDVLPSALRPPDLKPGLPKEVFVSYAWTDESTAVVDKLQMALDGSDITFLRDKDEIKYKDSIQQFMRRIGNGNAIVVVLSKRYLESKNCMFELAAIAGNGEIRGRVFPIILKDANIYDAAGRLDYINYWQTRIADLNARLKTVGAENLSGIHEELDLYARIRATIDSLMAILQDMNARPTVDELVSALEDHFAI